MEFLSVVSLAGEHLLVVVGSCGHVTGHWGAVLMSGHTLLLMDQRYHSERKPWSSLFLLGWHADTWYRKIRETNHMFTIHTTKPF